ARPCAERAEGVAEVASDGGEDAHPCSDGPGRGSVYVRDVNQWGSARPGHTSAPPAGHDLRGRLEGLQVDYRDVVVAVDGDVGLAAVRVHQDPFHHPTQRGLLRPLAAGGVPDEGRARVA